MHTVDTFIASFPEFGPVDQVDGTVIQEKLNEAAEQIDESVWKSRATTGHGYLTAHLLAMSPLGNAAKLVSKDGSTTYEIHYKRLVRIATAGLRTT